jgi:hypothetical protein
MSEFRTEAAMTAGEISCVSSRIYGEVYDAYHEHRDIGSVDADVEEFAAAVRAGVESALGALGASTYDHD